MARYEPVLRIVISHEYLDGQPLRPRFVPDANSAARMAREDVLLRQTDDGVEVWRVQQLATQAHRAAVPLVFAVFCDDPQLRYCTAWPVAPPLRYIIGADGVPAVETLAGSGAARQPLLSVEIDDLPPARQSDGEARPPTLCRIDLAARKVHWKYFFSGTLAAKKLGIVDLDASSGGAVLEFGPSTTTAVFGGAALTSAVALPMQRLPRQRLQLRDEGGAGRVLIRRLPNADVAKLGKERGPDGESMIVAEIYIHQ